jgi:hypothetical protein
MLISAWLIHTVTRARVSSGTTPTGKGDPTYAAQDTIAARVERQKRKVSRGDGEVVDTTHVMATDAEVRMTDVFWFPSIAGEAADDVTAMSRGRRPVSVVCATNKLGTQALWQVYF